MLPSVVKLFQEIPEARVSTAVPLNWKLPHWLHKTDSVFKQGHGRSPAGKDLKSLGFCCTQEKKGPIAQQLLLLEHPPALPHPSQQLQQTWLSQGFFCQTLHPEAVSSPTCPILWLESWILYLLMTDHHFTCAAKKPWASSARKWLQGQKINGLIGWMTKHLRHQENHMLVYGDTNCKEHIDVHAGYKKPVFSWAS